jgi:radical SAM protein (TIGR01212 family)
VPLGEIWLDMGLQSAHDATLTRIGRGHDAASFATACERAAACGLLVCGHVILGLPGETQEHWLSTIDFLNRLPVAGVKFHNLFVSRGSALESAWQAGRFIPPEMDAYVQGLARCLERLRPDVVIHRLHADPAPGELAAPAWAADRPALRRAIENILTRLDAHQGMDYHPETGPNHVHGRKP